MIQTPTFWSKRQDTLLQYYGTASRQWASTQLLLMLMDPFLQNTQAYLLWKFVWSTECCASLGIGRALILFAVLYWLVSFVAALTGASNFINCLNDGRTKTQMLLVVVAHLCSLQMFAFGFAPSLHGYFKI